MSFTSSHIREIVVAGAAEQGVEREGDGGGVFGWGVFGEIDAAGELADWQVFVKFVIG